MTQEPLEHMKNYPELFERTLLLITKGEDWQIEWDTLPFWKKWWHKFTH